MFTSAAYAVSQQMALVVSRQQLTESAVFCLQNNHEMPHGYQSDYVNYRCSGELQDLSLQNLRFMWARVSQT